jgi:hypothetical protein
MILTRMSRDNEVIGPRDLFLLGFDAPSIPSNTTQTENKLIKWVYRNKFFRWHTRFHH